MTEYRFSRNGSVAVILEALPHDGHKVPKVEIYDGHSVLYVAEAEGRLRACTLQDLLLCYYQDRTLASCLDSELSFISDRTGASEEELRRLREMERTFRQKGS